MLTIFNKGQTEALSHYSEYELYEEVNGPLTLNLLSHNVPENIGHKLVEEEAIIESLDGREFRIKQLRSTRKGQKITALSRYFELGGHQKHDIFGGTHTLNEFATWLFKDTGWTFDMGDVTTSRFIPNFGKNNFLQLMDILLSNFSIEFKVEANNHIQFNTRIGPDRDAQYRYGYNIKTLARTVDTNNVRTSITGFGANDLVVKYTSPNKDKFPHIGEADPFTDENITEEKVMLEALVKELIDTPEVAIELDALELTTKELGERVWLDYEPLGLEFETRILSKTIRIPESKSSAVIGNAIPKTITDAIADNNVKIDENDKKNQSRIEQTNEHIGFAVERLSGEILEAYAYIDITADGISNQVGAIKIEIENEISKGVADSKSYVDQTALQIQSGIQTQVSYLDGRIEDAETQVTMLAGEVTTAVVTTKEYTDSRFNILNGDLDIVQKNLEDIGLYVDGELGDVFSNIDAVIDTVGTLRSDLTTLSGDVIAVSEQASSNFDILSGSINASVTTTRTYAETVAKNAKDGAIQYTDGLIDTVKSTASSNFDILSGRITSKAEAVTVTNLGTRVTYAEQSVNALNGSISNIVSFTDVTGAQIVSKVNQTADTFKVSAKNIQLDGITEVASALKIGSSSSGNKSIWFNNYSGIDTFSNTLSMQISSSGNIYMIGAEIRFDDYYSQGNGSTLNLGSASNIIWGNNLPTIIGKFG